MTKIVLFTSTVLLLVAITWCKPAENDAKPGYCKINDVYVKKGEWIPAPIGLCHEYQCDDPETNATSGTGCGTLLARPPCYVVEDLTKPYPECCPKIKCDE